MAKICKVISLEKVNSASTRILFTERGDKILLGQLEGVPAETTIGIQFSEETSDTVGEKICQTFNGEYFNKVAAGFSVPDDRMKKISVEEFYGMIGSESPQHNKLTFMVKKCFALDGPKYRVVIVQAGVTLNDIMGNPITFSSQVLKGAVPLFNGMKVRAFRNAWNPENFTHLEDAATTWPEEVLAYLRETDSESIVGVLNNAQWSDEENGLIADMTVDLANSMGRLINNLLFKANEVLGAIDKFMGLSMVVSLLMNKKGEVTDISSVDGVDVVSVPAAGGHFSKVLMSVRVPKPLMEEFKMNKAQMIELLLKFSPSMTGLQEKSEAELMGLINELKPAPVPAALSVTPANPNPVLAGLEKTVQDMASALTGVKDQFTKMQDDNSKKALFMVAENKINSSNLPTLSKQKLLKILPTLVSFSAEVIDGLISDENTYITSLNKTEGFTGFGAHFEQGDTSKEKLEGALDVAFGVKGSDRAKYGSIGLQEFYRQATGDIHMTQKYNKRFAAVTSTEFSNVLGNTLYRRLLQVFAEAPYDENVLVSTRRPQKDFRTVDASNIGGFATLPTVAEDNPYLPINHPTDWKTSYAILKKGGLLGITWETILNDDLGLVNRLITNFARAARRTHAAYVFNLMLANPTMYDSIALFEAGTHTNLGSAAYAYSTLLAAYKAMIKQAEPGSAFRMGITPYHLFVPAEVYDTAISINQSEVQDVNLQYAFAYHMFGANNERIWNVPFMTDVNNWYVCCNPAFCETIEMSYLNGVTVPEMFAQSGATEDTVFTADRINYKMRFVFGGAVVEWRGFYGAVVA